MAPKAKGKGKGKGQMHTLDLDVFFSDGNLKGFTKEGLRSIGLAYGGTERTLPPWKDSRHKHQDWIDMVQTCRRTDGGDTIEHQLSLRRLLSYGPFWKHANLATRSKFCEMFDCDDSLERLTQVIGRNFPFRNNEQEAFFSEVDIEEQEEESEQQTTEEQEQPHAEEQGEPADEDSEQQLAEEQEGPEEEGQRERWVETQAMMQAREAEEAMQVKVFSFLTMTGETFEVRLQGFSDNRGRGSSNNWYNQLLDAVQRKLKMSSCFFALVHGNQNLKELYQQDNLPHSSTIDQVITVVRLAPHLGPWQDDPDDPNYSHHAHVYEVVDQQQQRLWLGTTYWPDQGEGVHFDMRSSCSDGPVFKWMDDDDNDLWYNHAYCNGARIADDQELPFGAEIQFRFQGRGLEETEQQSEQQPEQQPNVAEQLEEEPFDHSIWIVGEAVQPAVVQPAVAEHEIFTDSSEINDNFCPPTSTVESQLPLPPIQPKKKNGPQQQEASASSTMAALVQDGAPTMLEDWQLAENQKHAEKRWEEGYTTGGMGTKRTLYAT